jgi:RND family efflux transporter MFP subunit
MFVIASVDNLEVTTGINEQNVGKIHVGQEVLMKINSVSDQWFSGSIKEINQVMNSQTKNYPVTITLSNQDDKLVAGMYAEIQVIVDHADNVLVIPVDAITYKDGNPFAYITQADGTVKEVALTLGLNDGDNYVVTAGLQAGDQIIVKGNSDFVDGAAVTVQKVDGVAVDTTSATQETEDAAQDADNQETQDKKAE